MKRMVAVTVVVEVEVDAKKFTDAWMADWRKSFYSFDSVDDHIEHIAQLEARGLLSPAFTEGYGPLSDMGIKASVAAIETEIVNPLGRALRPTKPKKRRSR